MIIYIDENLSPNLSRALDVLEQSNANENRASVKCIQDDLEKGTKDVVLIPFLGKRSATWITQDKHLLKRKSELDLILRNKIGLFILTPYWSKQKHWGKVKIIINRWLEIKKISTEEQKPFAYRIEGKSGKIVKIDVN